MATFKQKNFNINTAYRQLVHRPICIDDQYVTDKGEVDTKKFVMYVHSDDWKADSETTADETAAEKSKRFKEQKDKTYNSPTNIRRVFFTGRGVGVQYYISPMMNGKRSEVKWQFKPYQGEENLFDIANKIFSYSKEMANYHRAVAQSTTGKADIDPPVKYNITGNGVGLLSTPWVCSNVEEIYFDWTLLLSDNVKPYFQNVFGKSIQEVTQRIMQTYTQQGVQMQSVPWDEAMVTLMKSSKKTSIINHEAPLNLFMKYCTGGVKDVRARFPRLRTIAMVQNLDEILKQPQTEVVDQSFSSVEASTQTWIQLNHQLVELSGGLVVKYSFKDLPKYNDTFVTRKGLWKLDTLLDEKISVMKQKILETKRAGYKPLTSSKDEELDESGIDKSGFQDGYSKLEIMLLANEQLFDNGTAAGKKIVSTALQYAAKGNVLSKPEWQTVISRISKENRKKYADIIGIDLNAKPKTVKK